MKNTYGLPPIKIASDVIIDNSEMYFYQYLPVRLSGKGSAILLPNQLERLRTIVNKACEDFIKEFGADKYYLQNIYLTAKCLYTPTGSNINRPGWHSDGFMTDDINYIWSDSLPTEYITGNFQLIQDHEISLYEMNHLIYDQKLKCQSNCIYRLNQSVIHRPQININNPFVRHFVKISFSKEQYNLKGNAHNYLLDYNWEMKDRSLERNHPIK
ncbi:hypothetical protein KO02_12125 [Sphingobacterium sp. ML3W]|uniref:hypothetical protein n=1 Tax=Sphingobacterium sp. ML3W TaxID=1538644 RepID=UPI0004F66C0F|nr:hypothetical protein [Sphingobacterium sp. ML3W]AIM37356.1 hypothetical protein KO02_12125 [Sphingobacterium sp. ML3W]